MLVAVTKSAWGPAHLSPLKRLLCFTYGERGEKCPTTSALRAVFSAETGSNAERSDSEVDRFTGAPGGGGFAENGGGGFAEISTFSPAAASASPSAASAASASQAAA